MKIVGNVIGRWINRRSQKAQTAKLAQTEKRPQELDNRTLRQVSGGDAEPTQTPRNGW